MLFSAIELYGYGALLFWAFVLIVRAMSYRDTHDDD